MITEKKTADFYQAIEPFMNGNEIIHAIGNGLCLIIPKNKILHPIAKELYNLMIKHDLV